MSNLRGFLPLCEEDLDGTPYRDVENLDWNLADDTALELCDAFVEASNMDDDSIWAIVQ